MTDARYLPAMSLAECVPASVRVQLGEMAAELRLPDPVVDRTLRLYGRLSESEVDDAKVNPLCWLACIIVAEFNEDCSLPAACSSSSADQVGEQLSQQPPQPPPWTANVSVLLRKANVHCKEFMKRIGVLTELGVYSQHTIASIRRLQRGYCVSCALFHKLRSLVNDTMSKVGNGSIAVMSSNGDTPGESAKARLTQMTWVLYLLGKEHMMLRCDDLVTNFYLLLCCFVHTLKQARSPSPGRGNRTTTKEQHIDESLLMQQLCLANHADITEVNILFSSKSWDDFINHYVCTSDKDSDIQRFRNLYLNIHNSSSSLNELDFCDDNINPMLLPEETSPSRAQGHNGRAQHQAVVVGPSVAAAAGTTVTASSTGSAVQMQAIAVPQTPVRTALNTVQQLKALLAQASDTPSNVLVNYMEECSVNPSELIRQRIEDMRVRYETSYPSQQGSPLAPSPSQRYQLVVRLYYRVLEAMLKSEEKRLSRNDFLALLNNDIFNRALLVCCADVINKTYQCCDDADYESCASVFELHPYNLCKIVESFILAEPHLPKEIIQHLQIIENHILEQRAWQRDSPLFENLNAAALTSVPVAPAGAEPAAGTSCTIQAGSVSPARPVLSLQHFMSPARPTNSHDEAGDVRSTVRRPRSVTMFLNKVCRLGYQRLQQMCMRLDVGRDLMARFWTCLEYTITNRWDLLQNRHIDQIMMCCIYGICKVVDHEIKFKRIVDVYKTMPSMRPEVYRSVYIADGEQPDSIIGFYNRIFMHNSKSYLLQFSPTSRRQPPSSPAPKTITPGSPSMIRKNFYVSPLREPLPWQGQSSVAITLTPQSRQLYSFGEPGSAEKLRSINELIRISALSPAQSGSARKRALNFDSQNINGSDKPKDPASVRKQMRFDDDLPPA